MNGVALGQLNGRLLRLIAVLMIAMTITAALMGARIHRWNFWLGSNATGAILKGAGILLMLPLGTGYLLVKAVRRRARV